LFETEKGYYSIISHNQEENLWDLFTKGLLIFANVGNGDLICFDYRQNPKSDNPSVVYWDHEEDEDKNVSFIAKDFDAFLSMLYADEN